MSRSHLSLSVIVIAAGLAAAPSALAGDSPSKRTPAERDAARLREAENDAVEQALKDAWAPAAGGGCAAVTSSAPKTGPAGAGKVPDASDRLRAFHEAGEGRFAGALRDLSVEAGPWGLRVEPLDQGLARPDQGLSYRLASVRAGSTTLVDAGSSDAIVPERERPDVVLYRRSGGVEERYELQADGVEQTFVLTDAGDLTTGADLVIEGAIETALAADLAMRTDVRSPITFRDAGGPVLAYGRAFAIDASGRRLGLPTQLSGSTLSIVVDGAWLAQASFPVTVDPLIGTFFAVASGLQIEQSCDVAYSPVSDRYLVVWEDEFTTSDHDIYGILYDGQGAAISTPFAIDDSLDDSLRPSCAWSPNGDRFLVAYEDDANLFGAYDIFGSIVDLVALQFGPSFEVYASASNHGLAHVGAEDAPGGGFLVVWTLDFWLSSQDYDAAARRVSAAGAPVGGIIDLDASSSYDTYDTTVNKLGRGATPWLAAMVDDRAVAGDLDVFVRSVSSGGSLGATFDVAFSTDPEFSPSVAGDGSELAVAYVRDVGAASGASDRDVYVQRASGAARVGASHLAALSFSHEDRPSISRWEPAGAAPAAEYLVAWRDRSTTPASIEADRLSAALAPIENDVPVSAGFEDDRPAVAARRGSARQEWLVAWQRTFSATDIDIRAQRFQDVPPPVPVADFSAGARNGNAPLAVTFTDLSSGNPTAWAWDFQNDGTVDATTQGPSFTYTVTGTYTVKLTVTAPGGTDSETKVGYVVVTATSTGGGGGTGGGTGGGGSGGGSGGAVTPVADFDAGTPTGFAPLIVTFNDRSTGTITGWTWSFGDGVTSSVQNPTHTFVNPGVYTVFLTVDGPGGIDTRIRQSYIDVSGPQGGTGGGTSGGGVGQGGGGGRVLRSSGGGGGGGCAISPAAGGGDAAGAMLPLLALLSALAVARRVRLRPTAR